MLVWKKSLSFVINNYIFTTNGSICMDVAILDLRVSIAAKYVDPFRVS